MKWYHHNMVANTIVFTFTTQLLTTMPYSLVLVLSGMCGTFSTV